MDDLIQLKDYISKRWPSGQISEVCARIIDFVASNPESRSRFLTYAALGRIAGVKEGEVEQLVKAVSILSARFNILTMHFVFIDGEGNEYPLEDEDARMIMQDGYLNHPDSNERVDNISAFLYPYYEGNKNSLSGVPDARI